MKSYLPWLNAIKEEIKTKYKIQNSIFLLDNIAVDQITFDEWAYKNIVKYAFWVQYRHIKDNIFELKAFTPNPPEEVCQAIIDDFFRTFYQSTHDTEKQCRFTLFGDCTYSEKEMKQELLFYLHTGMSKINVDKTSVIDQGTILYTLSVELDNEIQNFLKNGYLVLEFFE